MAKRPKRDEAEVHSTTFVAVVIPGVQSSLGVRASLREWDKREGTMTVACFIRYQIDPFQREEFRKYAENWGRIIPRLGGHLVGYFLPHEGTNDIAWGVIAFDSLASYEAYRTRLKCDPEARANFAMAQTRRIILREERTFAEVVEGTFEIAPRNGKDSTQVRLTADDNAS